jgi:phosphatidate cytidylyltransferase
VAASNLTLRLGTAAVVVPPLLYLMYLGPSAGFFVAVLVAATLAARELFRMTHPGDAISQVVCVSLTLAAASAVYLCADDPRVLLTAFLAIPLIGILLPLFRLGDIATAGLRMTAGAAGPIFVGATLATLALLRRDFTSGPSWVLLALMFAWLADTGGYFFGRFLGKTPLYPAVSPKKTRAGFVGALVGACVGTLIAHFWYLPELDLARGLPLAVVAGAAGQLGDLAESLLKRSTGIKDSGSLVPGHGGMLDRVDALLVVGPLVYLFAAWTAS